MSVMRNLGGFEGKERKNQEKQESGAAADSIWTQPVGFNQLSSRRQKSYFRTVLAAMIICRGLPEAL